MGNAALEWLQNLPASDLEPIVCQILNQPKVEILNWEVRPLVGGAAEYVGLGFGVYQVTGQARFDGSDTSWVAVAKILGPSEHVEYNSPASTVYWKREVLVYQAKLLEQLPGNMVAARCYKVQEMPDEQHCIWLEAVEEIIKDWEMEHHQLAARHLGQFNGAYLAGHPLPEQKDWMMPGRMHQWLELLPPDRDKLIQFSESDLGGWLSRHSVDRIMNLWEKRKTLVDAYDRLPTCYCHHDAFRRNLMLRKRKDNILETVAIDWAFTGPGKVGEEIAVTTCRLLWGMDVSVMQAHDFDAAVFEGYSAGLRDAGWKGDLQLARFGYWATVGLTSGVAFSVYMSDGLAHSGEYTMFEAFIGHPADDIIEQWAEVVPFLLDMGEKALTLLPSLNI